VVEDGLASVAKTGAQLRLLTSSARSEGPGIEHKPMRDAPAIDVKSANVVSGTEGPGGPAKCSRRPCSNWAVSDPYLVLEDADLELAAAICYPAHR
jgi:hypothetical protein